MVIKIAIVEKSKLYRESLRTALNQILDFEVVFDTGDYCEIIQFSENQNINLVLLDYSIGKTNCVKTIEQTLKQNPNLKIIILSDFVEAVYFETIIKTGVQNVILKKTGKHDIVKQIRKTFEKSKQYDF